MPDYISDAGYIAQSNQGQPGVLAAPFEQAQLFLQSVWGALPKDPNNFEVVGLVYDDQYTNRATGETRNTARTNWQFASDRDSEGVLPDMLAWAAEHNTTPTRTERGQGSIFWMGASRRDSVMQRGGEHQESYARGRLDELCHVGSFWADVDLAASGAPLEPAYLACLALPLSPTFIIFSGGGLQVVYALRDDTPWALFGAEAGREYKLWSRSLFEPLFRQLGAEADTSVHEATRMMRLPGFVNRKPSRKGALAQIIYHDPAARYTPDQIRAAAQPYLPPPRPKADTPLPALNLPANQFLVSQKFVAHLLNGTPMQAGERHNTMRALAIQAAGSGMPREQFHALAWPRWEADKRIGAINQDSEFADIVDWAYTRAPDLAATGGYGSYDDDLPVVSGEFLIELESRLQPALASTTPSLITPVGSNKEEKRETEAKKPAAKLVIDEGVAERVAAQRIVKLSGPPPRSSVPVMSLGQLRAEQEQAVRVYLGQKAKRGVGTTLRLHTPPGAGKTHIALRIAADHALKHLRAIDKRQAEEATGPGDLIDQETDLTVKDGVLVATLFKMSPGEGRTWARNFGIDPDAHPRLLYLFTGRTPEPVSKGYCANHELAEAVARKGRNVHQTVCLNCPFATQCKETGYLSQFEEAKNYGILVARLQHLRQAEMLKGRKIVVIDESPLALVAEPIIATAADLKLSGVQEFVQDQYADEYALVEKLLSALRGAITANAERVVQLGGRWLFDALARSLTEDELYKLAGIPGSVIDELAQVYVSMTANVAEIAALPTHFLPELMQVYKAEYPLFKAGAERWNSRFVVRGHRLHIHVMQPFAFTQDTKVIVTDATEPEELYPAAFSDYQGRPRQILPYRRELEPRGQVIVLTGTENTKTTLLNPSTLEKLAEFDLDGWLRSKGRRKRDYTYTDTLELAAKLRDMNAQALAQILLLIHQAADRHGGSLLTVMYKKLVEESSKVDTFLAKWLRRSGVLDPSYMQWYGNLRGRNDFQHMDAALAIGTPRLKEEDLHTQAQVWNWRDVIPIDLTRAVRDEPFLGYQDEDGLGRARRYIGYQDERVSRLYLNSMQAELRQSYERIRKDVSDTYKTVYLATDFPCSTHVTEFRSFEMAHVAQAVELAMCEFFDEIDAVNLPLPISLCIERIVTLAQVSERTAKAAYMRERQNGYDPRDGIAWAEKFEQYEGKKKALSPSEKIRTWIAENEDRKTLSATEVLEQMNAEGYEISRASVFRYFADNHRSDSESQEVQDDS